MLIGHTVREQAQGFFYNKNSIIFFTVADNRIQQSFDESEPQYLRHNCTLKKKFFLLNLFMPFVYIHAMINSLKCSKNRSLEIIVEPTLKN